MKTRETIFLLIGPKGSGKSFIGTLFDRYFQIAFLRVEDWAKKVKKGRNIRNEDYIKEVFEVIEKEVRKSLEKKPAVVFESTGLGDQFDNMLINLGNDFRVITIRVSADPNLCLKRVKTRDQTIHINVSDDQVNAINQAVLLNNRQADYEIQNSNKTREELKSEIEAILKNAFRETT